MPSRYTAFGRPAAEAHIVSHRLVCADLFWLRHRVVSARADAWRKAPKEGGFNRIVKNPVR